jgi:hypothetical protein
MSYTISSALEDLSIDNGAAPASASTQFPNEVVENIAHLTTDPATMACWMRVSRTMYNVFAPRLYTQGVVTKNGSLYVGCEGEAGMSLSAKEKMELILQTSTSNTPPTWSRTREALASMHLSHSYTRNHSCYR